MYVIAVIAAIAAIAVCMRLFVSEIKKYVQYQMYWIRDLLSRKR